MYMYEYEFTRITRMFTSIKIFFTIALANHGGKPTSHSRSKIKILRQMPIITTYWVKFFQINPTHDTLLSLSQSSKQTALWKLPCMVPLLLS